MLVALAAFIIGVVCSCIGSFINGYISVRDSHSAAPMPIFKVSSRWMTLNDWAWVCHLVGLIMIAFSGLLYLAR